jgi:hypothetical protein
MEVDQLHRTQAILLDDRLSRCRYIFASFTCHSAANKGSSNMSLHASATVQIVLGDPKHCFHTSVLFEHQRLSDDHVMEVDQLHRTQAILLDGVKCPDGTDNQLRWRNYLHPREVPWLGHHQVQGHSTPPSSSSTNACPMITSWKSISCTEPRPYFWMTAISCAGGTIYTLGKFLGWVITRSKVKWYSLRLARLNLID